MKHLSRRPQSAARTIVLACLLGALASGAAHAQTSPYYLRASQTFSYDSNLFRVPDAAGTESDVISTTALTVGLDQPISRQRLLASATVRGNAYRDNSELNGAGYDLLLGLDWEAASKLSGTARITASQSQAGFESYGGLAQPQSGRNQERSRLVDLRGQYGGASVLTLEAQANLTDISYSSTGFASRERESAMLGAGLRWRPGGPWSFGLMLRRTDGEYPRFSAIAGADEYTRNDVDLTAEFLPTGASRLSARITHTDEQHDLDASRDFSGVTGELRWNYQATGKLSFMTLLARETGSGSSTTTQLIPGGDETTTYLTDSRLTNRLGLQADWEATAKIRVTANFDYSRDFYDTQFLDGSGVVAGNRRGYSRRVGLTAGYAITRVWTLQCGLSRLSRDSGVTLGGQSYAYDANTASCSATLALQ
ncbi:MAG TPA: hypothetical protein VLI72_04395 [Methylibium sp.]|nr:hypothetical protein [Methylibium sp.]